MFSRRSLVILLVGINCMLTFGEETVFENNNISAPGEDCSSTPCDPESEICDNDSQTCVCNEETHVDVGGTCLKKAAYLGDDCTDKKQCAHFGEHSICYKDDEDEACICDPDKSFANDDFSKCITFAEKLGEPCTEDPQCQQATPGEHSYCEKETGVDIGKCSCSEGAENEPGRNKCLILPNSLGEECEVHFQCIKSFGDISICYNRKCDCMPRIGVPNEQNKMCLYIRNELGGDCIESVQCHAGKPGEFSLCSEPEKVCKCNSESVNVPGNNTCLQIAKLIGEKCEDNIQCRNLIGEDGSSNSTCMKANAEQTCGCDNVAIPRSDNKTCIPIVNQINGKCIEDRQCQLGIPGSLSACVTVLGNQVCQCNENSVSTREHKCLLAATSFEDNCEDDVQCTKYLGESSCSSDGKCSCIENKSVLDTTRTKCLPIKYLRERCEDIEQCLASDKNTECTSNRCLCDTNSTEIQGRCWARKSIGSSCETDEECTNVIGGEVTCGDDTNQCECLSGYIPEVDGLKVYCVAGAASVKFSAIIIAIVGLIKLLI